MQVVSILSVPKISQKSIFPRERGTRMLRGMKKKPVLPSSIAGLTPMELARKIPVAEAAAHNSLHVETFKKHYPHLLHRIGERRLFVTVRDMIILPPPDTS
jgi:hypothetical protein